MPMSKYTWLTLGGSTWYKSDLGTQEWKNALLSILGWAGGGGNPGTVKLWCEKYMNSRQAFYMLTMGLK